MIKTSLRHKIFLAVFGIVLCIILSEAALRLGGFAFLALQEFRNTLSLRRGDTYRIICLGESTTAVGDSDSYPSQLEMFLNQESANIKFSVINKGIPATNTDAITQMLEHNLNKYNPHMIVAMMGVNDPPFYKPYRPVFKKDVAFVQTLKIYKLVELLKYRILIKLQTIKNLQPKVMQEKKARKIIRRNDIRLAKTYRLRGEYSKAEEILTNSKYTGSKYLPRYKELARSYLFQYKYDEFLKTIDEGLKIDPNCHQFYDMLSMYYRWQKEHHKAAEMSEMAIKLNSNNFTSFFNLAVYYWKQKNYNEAKKVLSVSIKKYPKIDKLYGLLANVCKDQGDYAAAEKYFKEANRLRLKFYKPQTRANYKKLSKIASDRHIKLVCVQYPVRSVEPFKKMLEPKNNVIFVDNEMVFKNKLEGSSYSEYFTDIFGGDFGHCTKKGNKLLAENVGTVILKELSIN